MYLLSHAPLGQSACMYGGEAFFAYRVFRILFLSGILGMVARLSG
jgi:hypothetical protein